MYTKDKSQRITLRLNENQFEFVKGSADVLGVSPSDFLRMVINVAMAGNNLAQKSETNPKEGEVLRRENEETNSGDFV